MDNLCERIIEMKRTILKSKTPIHSLDLENIRLKDFWYSWKLSIV